MKNIIRLLFVLFCAGTLWSQTPESNNIIYVNQDSKEFYSDGISWNRASKSLAKTLKWAAESNNFTQSNPLKIYVAKGTYIPEFNASNLSESNPEDFAFRMVKNVHIYGGFDPEKGITTIDARRKSDKTILKAGTTTRHVLVAVGKEHTGIILDGFTIDGGNASGSGSLSINGESVARIHGGALNIDRAKMTIKNCYFRDNTAESRGGAIYSTGDGVGNTELKLINTTFYKNKSGSHGSAVSVNGDAKVIMVNCTVYKNISGASEHGGAIDSNGSGSQDINIYNTIIYGNQRINSSENILVNLSGGNANKFKNIRNIIYNGGWNSNYTSSASNYTIANPVFVHGLNDEYFFVLGSGSPAINAGNNSYYTDADKGNSQLNTGRDFYGLQRLIGSTIDIGAFENQNLHFNPTNNILYVKKGATGNGSSWSNAIGELADAIKWARQTSNSSNIQIWVAKGTYLPKYSPIDVDEMSPAADPRDNTFLMVNYVNIYGGFAGTESTLAQRDLSLAANKTTLSGKIDNTINYAYHIVLASYINTRLDGITIENGNANGINQLNYEINRNTLSRSHGGGIYNYKSTLNLSNVKITGNNALSLGGGMYNYESPATLTNVDIINNNASEGGGMYNGLSSPVIINVKIENNSAGNSGGGIFNNSSSPLLTNVAISKNTANRGGSGMINLMSSNPVLINTNIINNTSRLQGAGLDNLDLTSSPKLYNSIVWNNLNINNEITNVNNYGVAKPTYSHSLIQGSQPDNIWNTTFGIDEGNNIDVDPIFADNSTGNYQLNDSSPAINRGNNNLYINNGGDLSADKDLAGNRRHIGTNIDMGAYENQCNTPAPTGNSEQGFNQNDTLAALVVNGQNIKWYATQANAEAHANSLANTTVIVNNTTYYATQTIGQCESTASLAVLAYNPTLGVDDLNSTKQIVVYPNFVKDILNLKTDEKIENIKVFSLDGKMLMNKTMNSNKQVDVKNLSQGIYIIRVVTESGVKNIRFIKV